MWDYGAELKRSSPSSTVCLMCGGLFHLNLHISLGCTFVLMQSEKGWLEGYRLIISLDGCFLKSYCKGELITAVGKDGNDQMFPIAWAVVTVESKESWFWFLELLEDIDLVGGIGWTVNYDQQNEIVPAIKKLFPSAEHRCCARHVYFRKKFSDIEFKSYFWQVCKSGTPEEFNHVMGELKTLCKNA